MLQLRHFCLIVCHILLYVFDHWWESKLQTGSETEHRNTKVSSKQRDRKLDSPLLDFSNRHHLSIKQLKLANFLRGATSEKGRRSKSHKSFLIVIVNLNNGVLFMKFILITHSGDTFLPSLQNTSPLPSVLCMCFSFSLSSLIQLHVKYHFKYHGNNTCTAKWQSKSSEDLRICWHALVWRHLLDTSNYLP